MLWPAQRLIAENLMGRTARAGIYTEGSIIITDCKIYDNRTNWKNGGGYLWNDCVKLFDWLPISF